MYSGSEAGSYLRLIDFVHHSTLGLREIKKRRRLVKEVEQVEPDARLPDYRGTALIRNRPPLGLP